MTAGIIDLNAKIHSDDVLLGTVRSPSDLVFEIMAYITISRNVTDCQQSVWQARASFVST